MTTKHVLGVAAVILALAAVPAARAGEPSVWVRTAPLTQRRLTDRIVAYGVVAPETGRVENVSFPHAGRVRSLRVSLGQVVRRGEPLLTVQTDPSANLAYHRALTAVAYARGELRRTEELAAQRLATRFQTAAAKKSLADAMLRLHEQERLGAGRRTVVFAAPFGGVVMALSVGQGERIAAGRTLLQLARTDEMRANLGIEPEDATRVRPGMPVRLASVFATGGDVSAKVTRVQGMIDPQTQLVDVVVGFGNDGPNRLLPGTRVRGEIAVRSRVGWAVPRQAVLRDARGSYLFQVQDGRARRVDVATGIRGGALIGVSGPLDAALPVVVLGNYELKDGMKIRGSGP